MAMIQTQLSTSNNAPIHEAQAPPPEILSSSHKEPTAPPVELMTINKPNFLTRLFKYIFYIHLILISIIVVFITVRGLLSPSAKTHHFHPKKWYLPILSSTACAGIMAFTWQLFTRLNPKQTLKAAFWISPLFTCAFGILLVSIGTPASLAASVIVLVSSVLQSLYACWVNPRFTHANKTLTVSTTYNPPKVRNMVLLSILISILFSSFLISGIGGATATRTKLDKIFIFVIVVSLTWTMQTIRNTMQVMVAHIKYMQFACGIEVDFKDVVKNAVKYSMGSISIGSITVPILAVIRGGARAVSLVSGDVDEPLFCCADCCSGVGSSVVAYGNRWGFVHVGVYNKGIVEASTDTWEMFRRNGMEKMIDFDLTSSFCFLCGIAGGSICGLVVGTWALLIEKKYTTEVSIYAFLIGYFMNRVAMAWVQASVAAYYVAYAENPQSQQFDSTIPDYIQALQRSQL